MAKASAAAHMRTFIALVVLTCAFVLFAQVAFAVPLEPGTAPAVGASVDFGSVDSATPLVWTVESVATEGDSYAATLTRPLSAADYGTRDPLEWATSTTGFAAYFSTAEYAALAKANYEPLEEVPNFQRINVVGSELVVTVSAATLSSGSDGPHGNYSTTTNKCVVCHSAHQATAPAAGENWKLLSTSPADSCTYCHIDVNSRSTMKVYDGLASNYNTIPTSTETTTSAHRSMVVNGIQYGASCADCHTVHASSNAMTGNEHLDASILRRPASFDSAQLAALAAEPNPNVALSTWCLSCHSATAQPHDTSHLIQASTTTTGTAQYPVDGCTSCHAAGTDSSAFPHYVEGSAKFLVSTPTTQPVPLDQAVHAPSATQDGVCLRCHGI